MNKLSYGLLASTLLFAGTAMAAPYGDAGCGLGSVVFGNQGGLIQVVAATLNGTGVQTFGITTGTSNCTKAGVVLADKEQEAFFESNMQSLQQDMVAGEGEYLSALLGMFSCDDDGSDEKAAALAQDKFEQIFPSSTTNAKQALYSYKLLLSQEPSIAAACHL